MSGGELSGVDLARVALRAALESARKGGGRTATAKAKPRTTQVVRRGGREPMGLGAAGQVDHELSRSATRDGAAP